MINRLRRTVVDAVPETTLRRMQRVRHRETPDLEQAPGVRPRGVTPATVHAYDAHAARAEVTATVAAGLAHARVPYVLVPGPRGTVRQIAVSAEDRPAAVAAIESALTGPGWHLTGLRRGPVLHVRRVLAAPSGVIVTGPETGCEVGFWTRLEHAEEPRVDGGTHVAGTRRAAGANGVVDYLSADSWQRAVASPTHWPTELRPDVFDVREPVDLVYTWVDGADPAWQARRDAATGAASDTDDDAAARDDAGRRQHATAANAARFLSRDELRYSMRSVAMYAGWVRRIYIVTDAQTPGWLDPTHPKITVVDHRDIFTDASALPVFNSHAIESQLHHIDGLAERYLYLNDDMFFGRPLEPELFFTGNGLARFFLARDSVDLDPPHPDDLPLIAAAKNLRTLLEDDFGLTVRGKFKHVAHPQLRSSVTELEQRYPEVFAQVAASRWRHPDDVSVPSALTHWYAYVQGRAVPGDIGYRYQDIACEDTARRLDEIVRERPQCFCLNDVESAPHHLRAQRSALRQFFRAYFPLPAPWERPGN